MNNQQLKKFKMKDIIDRDITVADLIVSHEPSICYIKDFELVKLMKQLIHNQNIIIDKLK